MNGKVCLLCNEDKELSEFYENKGGSTKDGRMPYCKKCDNSRPRKISARRIARQRARQRATADLIQIYRDDFERLMETHLANALDEMEILRLQPKAEEFGNEVVRLKPGPAMAGEAPEDRIGEPPCVNCKTHHGRRHACPSCGHGAAPSGVRQGKAILDAAAIAEFNAGTARARSAKRLA